jgi:hypothetical protein
MGAPPESSTKTPESDIDALRARVDELQSTLEELRTRIEALEVMAGPERYRHPPEIELFGRRLPLSQGDVRERMEREFMLSVDDVPQVLLWIKRANRYFPIIEDRLRSKGLPEDLKYVAVVESGLRPKARSHAGAAGIWQFMPSTGAKYKLVRTPWIDERRDPIRSTDAALNYLRFLHDTFGDWLLAVAAYNMGEEALQRVMEYQGSKDFFRLVLPIQTERFIFKIASAKVLLSEPERYGFRLERDELYQPTEFSAVSLRLRRCGVDIRELAERCEIDFRELVRLNPHILRWRLPRGKYTIYVPKGKGARVKSYINDLNNSYQNRPCPLDGKAFYVVRKGDTLEHISKRVGISISNLVKWNRIRDPNNIIVGQRLLIQGGIH